MQGWVGVIFLGGDNVFFYLCYLRRIFHVCTLPYILKVQDCGYKSRCDFYIAIAAKKSFA